MKKSLIALAALGAFAGSAMAQSSVTMFGVVDLSVGNIEGSTDKYMMLSDGNASSRLGFRGVEDLGGGLRAGFWLEGGFAADDGASVKFDFRRRATLSLLGSWGEVRLGRDYTPTFWNWTVFDPFGTNGVGAATNLALEVNNIAPGSSYGTLVRTDNTIGYHLPGGLGGLYGQLMVAAGEGVAGTKYYGGRIGWAAGPFNVAAAYGETEVTLGDMNGSNWNIAGSWDLGFMRLSGFYGSIDVDDIRRTATLQGDVSQTNWFVGAWVPFGPWTIKGSYGQVDRSDGFTVGTRLAEGKADQWAIGFTYDLSKRTAFYGTYSSIDNDGNGTKGTAFRVSGAANAPTVSGGQDASGYQFGIRHSF